MRGSQAAFRLGTFSYHPYIILHFGFDYENETQFYILVFNFASVRKDKEMELALDNLTIVRYTISNSR